MDGIAGKARGAFPKKLRAGAVIDSFLSQEVPEVFQGCPKRRSCTFSFESVWPGRAEALTVCSAGFQAAVPCCPADLLGHSPNTRRGSAGPMAKPPLRGGRAGVAVGLAVTLQFLLLIRAHLPQPSAEHL